MKIKYILSVIAIVAFTQNTFAQYSQDAIRFSQTVNGSTSRIKAVGNAGTAVGGDLSNISGNPAGLGFFTRSEVSITPEFDNSKSNSTYFGQGSSATKNKVNLNNASLVLYNQLTKPRGADKNKGWLSVNYGVAFNRTNNFDQNIHYTGSNNANSINDYYADQGNKFGTSEGDLVDMAFQQGLIGAASTTSPLHSNNTTAPVAQEAFINRNGGQSAVDFSVGANYSNKLYLGLSLSFTDINYDSFSSFYEDGFISRPEGTPSVPTTRDYTSVYSQNQSVRGTGFSAKLGVIYKPVEAVRLGLTFTSPTFYNIDDSYNEGVESRINNVVTDPDGYKNTGNYTLNYNLRTPLKVAGGAAIFIKNFGFITGDVEYVDYSTAHLSSSPDYNADYRDNGDIKNLYKSTVNAHVGAEARITSFFLLRGGYGIQGDARKDNGSDIKTTSGGIGLRFGAYYVDATYAHSTGTQTIFPYDLGNASPAAMLRNTNNNAYLTLGYRF